MIWGKITVLTCCVILGGLAAPLLCGTSVWAEDVPALLPGDVCQIANGVWRIRFGTPEHHVPTTYRERAPMLEEINGLPGPEALPFEPEAIRCRRLSGRLAVYIHPASPLHDQLRERSGDYLVWGGLVVDFADPKWPFFQYFQVRYGD